MIYFCYFNVTLICDYRLFKMSDVCMNIDIVPQSNDDEMEPMFDSQIVGTDDWIIVYTQVVSFF